MRNACRVPFFYAGAALPFLSLAVFFSAPARPYVLVFGESNILLAALPAPGGFTLRYIHSINRTPVVEEFSIEGRTGAAALMLTRTVFSQLSTGMPFDDSDGFAVEGGHFVTYPHRVFTEIAVRVSPLPGHEMQIGKRLWRLSRWAKQGGLLTFRGAISYP